MHRPVRPQNDYTFEAFKSDLDKLHSIVHNGCGSIFCVIAHKRDGHAFACKCYPCHTAERLEDMAVLVGGCGPNWKHTHEDPDSKASGSSGPERGVDRGVPVCPEQLEDGHGQDADGDPDRDEDEGTGHCDCPEGDAPPLAR